MAGPCRCRRHGGAVPLFLVADRDPGSSRGADTTAGQTSCNPLNVAAAAKADIEAWAVRRSPTVKIRTTNLEQTGWQASPFAGVGNGKESHWISQIAGARRRRQSVAPDRTGAWPARAQHHGVLQGVQRADPEDGE